MPTLPTFRPRRGSSGSRRSARLCQRRYPGSGGARPALGVRQNDRRSFYMLASAVGAQGRRDEKRAILNERIQRDPTDVLARYGLAQTYVFGSYGHRPHPAPRSFVGQTAWSVGVRGAVDRSEKCGAVVRCCTFAKPPPGSARFSEVRYWNGQNRESDYRPPTGNC